MSVEQAFNVHCNLLQKFLVPVLEFMLSTQYI